MKTVVIIVLSYNKREQVLQCLRSLEKLQYPSFHVLLVDNHSTDGTPQVIREAFPDITLIENSENFGAAAGRNIGAEEAEARFDYDFLFFLDDDAEVAPDSLMHLVHALEKDAHAGIACAKAFQTFPPERIMSCGVKTFFFFGYCFDIGAGSRHHGSFDHGGYVDACGAFAMLIRRELFGALGGFDSAFALYGWEDVDMCLRARKYGKRTRYVPQAVVCHKGTRQGRKPIPLYEKTKARNFLLIIKRHATFLEKCGCLVFVPLKSIFLLLRFIAQGHFRTALAFLQGCVAAFFPDEVNRT